MPETSVSRRKRQEVIHAPVRPSAVPPSEQPARAPVQPVAHPNLLLLVLLAAMAVALVALLK
jgi:hypothetical protein